MSFVRAFVRWGCSTAAIASLAVPCLLRRQESQGTAAAAETPSYYGPQPATENIDLTMYCADSRRRLQALACDGVWRTHWRTGSGRG